MKVWAIAAKGIGAARIAVLACCGSALAFSVVPASAQVSAPGFEEPAAAAAPEVSPAPTHRRSTRRHTSAAPVGEQALGGLAGRYAVMRDKRDTGCMLTLDSARVRGGARAQLAPGCRDQGIVIFDPTVWQVVGGELVLTARAGHRTRLDPAGVGVWQKSPKEGGKPLGLKRL